MAEPANQWLADAHVFAWWVDSDLTLCARLEVNPIGPGGLADAETAQPIDRVLPPCLPDRDAHARALDGDMQRETFFHEGRRFLSCLQPLTNRNAEQLGVVGFGISVPERQDADLDQLPLAVALLRVDKHSLTEFITKQIQPLTGYTRSQWLADEDLWMRRMVLEDKALVLSASRKALVDEQPFDVRYRWLDRTDREVLVRQLSTPVSGFSGLHLCLYIGLDIENERAVSGDRPKHPGLDFQKLDVVSKLAGGIAHEFNNLLTSINGFAKMIFDETEPNSPHNQRAATILACGERAATLTDQLLKFSRKKVTPRRTLHLHQLIRQLAPLIRRSLGESIRLELDLKAEAPFLLAAESELEEVLLNLAVNAAEAMPQGGQFSIATRIVYVGGAGEDGERIEIRVRDTGLGIARDMQEFVFQPFVSTKEPGKGPGLGLSIVYSMIEANGGTISFTSEADQGTEFLLSFPRIRKESKDESTALPRENLHGTETLLVVENEETQLQLCERILREFGYTVYGVGDGVQAVELLSNHPDQIDMVVCDVMLPYMNGLQVVKLLKDIEPKLRVLYMSGYTRDAISEGEDMLFASNFLQKPFDNQRLAGFVRRVLDA